MSSSGVKTVFPFLLIPECLANYQFYDYQKDKVERVLLTFMVIKYYENISRNDELIKVVKGYVGSRAKEYCKILTEININPYDEQVWESTVPYYFESPEVIDAVNKLLMAM